MCAHRQDCGGGVLLQDLPQLAAQEGCHLALVLALILSRVVQQQLVAIFFGVRNRQTQCPQLRIGDEGNKIFGSAVSHVYCAAPLCVFNFQVDRDF